MKGESKRINFRKLPKKLLSCLLALVMLVGMVQVGFINLPKAGAVAQSSWDALNAACWSGEVYGTGGAYSVQAWNNRNYTIYDNSGNSTIWNIAIAFQQVYAEAIAENPNNNPVDLVNAIYYNGAFWARYGYVYDLFRWLGMSMDGYGYSNWAGNPKVSTAEVINTTSAVDDNNSCFVQISRDLDCALRDWKYTNVNELPNDQIQTYFYYAWATGIYDHTDKGKTGGWIKFDKWTRTSYYYINGGLNMWQNPQYTDCSNVPYLKNVINTFHDGNGINTYLDFNTMLTYDQGTLYNMAVAANNGYSPVYWEGRYGANGLDDATVWYWYMLHFAGAGAWYDTWSISGVSVPFSGVWWRVPDNRLETEGFNNNYNTKVNSIHNYVTNINNAYQAKAYVDYVNYINTVRANGYDTNNIDQMNEYYNNIVAYFNAINSASDTVKNILIANMGYDAAATQALINQIGTDINLFWVRANYNAIETQMNTYGRTEYTAEQQAEYGTVYNLRHLSDDELNYAIYAIGDVWNAAITNYVNAGYGNYVSSLYPNGRTYVYNYVESARWELNRRGADAKKNQYYSYFLPRMTGTYVDRSTAEIEALISEATGVQGSFNADFSASVATIGQRATNEIYPVAYNAGYANFNIESQAWIDSLYTILNQRLIAEIDPVLDYLALNENNISLNTFTRFNSLRKLVEDDIHTWLQNTNSSKITPELAEKYGRLANFINNYNNFVSSYDVSNFVKNDLSSQYPVRPGSETDYARKTGEDFAVTKENLNASISKLDNFLYSEDFAKLLKLEEEGTNVNNLSSYVDNLLGETVFNNEMMNTLVAALMPMLQETLEGELKKTIAANNPYNINLQTEVLGQDATVTGAVQFFIDNDLCDGQQKQGDFPTLFKQLGLYVYPSTFAEMLSPFPEIQNALYAAGRNWGAFADADGDVELNFDWGIDNLEGTAARYARFKEVLSSVFNASLPVLKTLLGTAAYNGTVTNAVFAKTSEKLRAYVKLFGSDVEIASSNLNANANLTLNIEGVDLLRKVWIPVMEALGLNTTEHPYNFGAITDASTSLDIVNAMFEPIYELINELVSSPISRVVEMIPNLAYMVSFDKLSDLFNLNVNLSYSAKLTNTDASNDLIDIVLKLGVLDNLIKGDLVLDVSDMIDIDDLLGFDTSDFNSILSFVLDAADLGEVALPELNMGKYISYSTVNANYPTQRVGSQRVYFTADKADVFFALIKELVSALGNQGFIDSIIGALNSNRTNPIELSEEIQHIINSLNVNTDMAVCAIIELLNPQTYAFDKMNWFDMAGYDAIEGVTPASVAYLNYSNNWTKEKAEYITENIDDIVSAVLNMAGIDEADLRETLTGAIKNVFTNKTITSVMKTFVKFGDALDETLSGLIKDETGVDLSLWANAFGYLFDANAVQGSAAGLSKLSCVYDSEADTYAWSFDGKAFEDGDVNSFTDILCYILEGISPLVSFIFTGEDISLFAGAVTAKGYKGYGEAIPYLFEALGIENVLTQAQYEATYGSKPTEGLNYIIKTLLSRIDEILENPVSEILDVIPGIVYYLESNGLSTAIKAILKPVLTLIDTIRPIYQTESIDPNTIVKNLIADLAEENPDIDINTLGISIDNLSLEKIIEIADVILKAKSGVEIKEIVSPAVRAVCNTKVSYSSAASDMTGYTVSMDSADTLTVLVTTLIELLQYGNNAEAFDEMFETDGLLPAILNIFNSVVSEMAEPDWAYAFRESDGTFDYNNLPSSAALSQLHRVYMLSYTNDWTKEKAEYIDANLDEIILDIAKSAGSESASISDIIDSFDIYSSETVAKLAGEIKSLVNNIDPVILSLLGNVIGSDLSAILDFSENADDYNVTDGESFVDEICNLLVPVEPILSYMFLGTNLEYFTSSGIIENTSKGDSVIKLEGAEGYKYGIIPVLEALGINAKSADEYDNAIDCLKDSLTAICSVIDEIETDPVNKVLALIPNLLYFINANGLTTSVNNALAALYSLVDTIGEVTGDEIEISEALGFDISDLSMNAILALVKDKTGIDLLSSVGDIITRFYVGTIESFESANGRQAFRMHYDEKEDRADMITIIVTIAALIIKDSNNAEAVSKLLGEETYEAVTSLLADYDGEFTYTDPDWAYMYAGEDALSLLAANGLPQREGNAYENYTKYTNNWNEETSAYLTDNLDEIVGLILEKVSESDTTLGVMLENAIAGQIYKDDVLNSLLESAVKLLAGLDDTLIKLAGVVLEADFDTWFSWCEIDRDSEGKVTKATCTKDWGIDSQLTNSAKKSAFVSALTEALAPANRIISWFLFGQNYTFLNDTNGEDIITISGGEVYDFAIVPLLEALSIDGVKGAAQYSLGSGKYDVSAAIGDVVTGVCDKIAEICGDNTIDTVLEMLPNVIYFINANGISAIAENLLVPVEYLLEKLQPVIGEVDIEDAVGFPVKNITFETIFNLLEEKASIKLLPENKEFIETFYMGKVDSYTSANGKTAYRMTYSEAEGKNDMVTVIISMLLENVRYSENEEALKKLLGEDVYNVVIGLISVYDGEFEYTSPNWAYMYAGEDALSLLAANGLPQREGNAYANYTKYTNNWNEETASYVRDNLQEIVDAVISSISESDTTLGVMLENAVAGEIYKDEVLDALLEAVVKRLANIDSLLASTAGVVLGADIDTWFDWCDIERDADGNVTNVTCTKSWGINSKLTAAGKKSAFISALTEALAPANRVLAWLFLGENYTFLNDNTGADLITINGGEGYSYAVVPVLEALGCEAKAADTYLNEDGSYDVSAVTADVITALCDKVSELCGDNTIDVILDMLLNVIYFINADGVSVSVRNLLAPIEFLLEKLQPVTGSVDLEEAIGFPVKNITFETIFNLLADSFGISLRPENKEFIETFYMGKVDPCTSANGETAYRMTYSDKETSRDMMTIILSILLENVRYEDNRDALTELLGEDTYQAITDVLSIAAAKAMQDFSWLYKEYADTDKTFNPMDTSIKYHNTYDQIWTKDKAKYIADNFSDFVDDILCLLGLEINGVQIKDLTTLIEQVIEGNIYTQANADAVLEAVRGVVARITELEPYGQYVTTILEKSIGVDLTAWNDMSVKVTDGDREEFANAIAKIVAPLSPLFKVLLVGEDLRFFYDINGKDQILIPGSEGYAYGIIPLMEALGCDNVLTPAQFKSVLDTSADAAVRAVIDPVLDRIDEIMADPAEKILDMLPGVIYFINSNGVDTSVKNILNSIDTVIAALEPIIGASDICTLAGLELTTFNFDWIMNYALGIVSDSTGLDFTPLAINAVAELIIGKVVTYKSANGETYYTMKYMGMADKTDMVTVILRLVAEFFICDANIPTVLKALEKYVKDEDCYKADCALVEYLASKFKQSPSISGVLAVIYYIYYGLDIGVDSADTIYHNVNNTWKAILGQLDKHDNPIVRGISGELKQFLDTYLGGVFDSEGVASEGAITFWEKIINWFKTIFAKIKAIFS